MKISTYFLIYTQIKIVILLKTSTSTVNDNEGPLFSFLRNVKDVNLITEYPYIYFAYVRVCVCLFVQKKTHFQYCHFLFFPPHEGQVTKAILKMRKNELRAKRIKAEWRIRVGERI